MSCVNIKEVLEALAGSGVSSTARLIAIMEACGITDRAELERLTDSKPSTVREARRSLENQRQDSSAGKAAPEIQRQKSITAEIPAPEIQQSAGNPAPTLEIQRLEPVCTDLARYDSRASKESPSEIVILTGEVISPLTPQADRQPDPVALYEAIASLKPQRATRQRGSRLDSEWTLPDDWRDWAKTNCFAGDDEITRQADTFRDYWIAKPGAQACKLDWPATWRNWCRKAFSSAGRHRGTVSQPQSTGRFTDKPTNAFHDLVNQSKQVEATAS